MKITQDISERYPKLLETVDYYNRTTIQRPVFWEDNVGGLSIVEAVTDRLTWEFLVEESHCNQ